MRETQIYYIAYTCKLKKGYKRTYLQNRNRVTDVENKLMVTKGVTLVTYGYRESGGGINCKIGTDRLLHIKTDNQ